MFTPNLSPKQLYPSYYLFKYKHSKSFILTVKISEKSSIILNCFKNSDKGIKEIQILKSSNSTTDHKQIHFYEFAKYVKPVLSEISRLFRNKGPFTSLQESREIHRVYEMALLSLTHSSISIKFGEISSRIDFYNESNSSRLKSLSVSLNRLPIQFIEDKLFDEHFIRIHESLVRYFSSPELISIKPV